MLLVPLGVVLSRTDRALPRRKVAASIVEFGTARKEVAAMTRFAPSRKELASLERGDGEWENIQVLIIRHNREGSGI